MAENWTVKSVDGVDINKAEEAKVEETQAATQTEEQAVVEEAAAENPNVEIQSDETIKVNLDEPVKQEENVEQVSDEQSNEQVESTETKESEKADAPIELVTEEEPKKEDLKEETVEASAETVDAIQEAAQDPKIELPENVEKLVKFMEETGGSVEDYVSLNKDYSKLSDSDLVREYYRQKYPHYDEDRITRRMAKEFLFNEEEDDAHVIEDKKDAFSDAVYDAKAYLEDRKSKYYDELKLSRKNDIPEDYQKAYEIAQNITKAEESNKQLQDKFLKATDNVFSEDFKGFDFKVGENTYRYKVADPAKTKSYQSDINNFVREFIGEDGSISDAAGYHKAMFAAKNVDKIAQHFYEQGRAEALKQSAKEAKNIDMDPRQDMSATVTTKSGTKVRVVDNNEFGGKLKFKNYNNR